MPCNPFTRRIFLQRGLTLLAAAPTVPAFLDSTVLALTDPLDSPRVQQPSGKDGKILVVLQLSGGNDGLNTVIPYADDLYHRARPSLGHDAKTVLKIDDYLALHPNLGPLKSLYDKGNLCVVQGVGYPNPNRSHFRAMDIWQSAAPEKEVVTDGWIGRYFDNTCAGCDPRVGVSIGQTQPLAMKGQRITPLEFERPDLFRYGGADTQHFSQLNQAAANDPPAQKGPAAFSHASQLDFIHRTAMDAQVSSEQILRTTGRHAPAANYPRNELGQSLQTVASLIAGGLPTRVYYVSFGGFDTHAGERQRHDNLMTQLGEALAAFWSDLAAQKNTDRVLMMTFSEFGRRVAQNASGGTDHGAAAPMFLLGTSLQKGIVGKHPSLADLDQGDLKFQVDFRSVYAAVLQGWLQTPSKPILGQQFSPAEILKG
jgi:uncharacterized protein (DUF1501 family)